MSYDFYGWQDAKNVHAINNENYTPCDLYDALSEIWCEYTCTPRLREKWNSENITLGQCAITSFLAQDIFGGKVFGILMPGGNYHCYNVVDGHVFDLTSEQFEGEILDYDYKKNNQDNQEQFREIHFLREEKRRRYEYLKSEFAKIRL